MRTLRKRITCANRDDYIKNTKAINKVMQRYIEKMKARGWHFLEEKACITAGDAFSRYEQYFTMYKPNLNNDKDVAFIKANL